MVKFKIPTGLQMHDLRVEAGLTQKQVEEKTGISYSVVSNLENGENTRIKAYRTLLEFYEGYQKNEATR